MTILASGYQEITLLMLLRCKGSVESQVESIISRNFSNHLRTLLSSQKFCLETNIQVSFFVRFQWSWAHFCSLKYSLSGFLTHAAGFICKETVPIVHECIYVKNLLGQFYSHLWNLNHFNEKDVNLLLLLFDFFSRFQSLL